MVGRCVDRGVPVTLCGGVMVGCGGMVGWRVGPGAVVGIGVPTAV